jgi:hypothetical protein
VIAFLLLAQDQDRLGTIPDWIAALGTVAAFLVALRLLAKELTARREVEEDRRRAQARLVSAWTTPRRIETAGPELKLEFIVVLKNGSDEPVHEVWLTLVPDSSPFASDPEAARAEDGTVKDPDTDWGNVELVPPGETFNVAVMPGRYPIKKLVLGISFTDSQGRRWRRLPGGTLIEASQRRHRSRKDFMNAWIAGELDHLDN